MSGCNKRSASLRVALQISRELRRGGRKDFFLYRGVSTRGNCNATRSKAERTLQPMDSDRKAKSHRRRAPKGRRGTVLRTDPRLVLLNKNSWNNFGVKATRIDDRKLIRIG